MRRYHWWTHPVLWAWVVTVGAGACAAIFCDYEAVWPAFPVGLVFVTSVILTIRFYDPGRTRGNPGTARRIWGTDEMEIRAVPYDSGDTRLRLEDRATVHKRWICSPERDWRRLPDLETAMMEAIALAEELTTNKAEAEARIAQLGRLLDAHSEILKELQ